MRRTLPLMLLFAIVCVGAVLGQDEESPPSKKATPEDYKRIAAARTYSGKLSVGAKTVTFRIDDSDYRKKLKWAQGQPAAQQKILIYQVEQQFASMKWALGKEFELPLSDKVALRKLNIPEGEFDDKGNYVAFTGAVKAKLKGSPSLPGYVAKAEDFAGDAIVTATFGAMKEGRPTVVMLIVNNKLN